MQATQFLLQLILVVRFNGFSCFLSVRERNLVEFKIKTNIDSFKFCRRLWQMWFNTLFWFLSKRDSRNWSLQIYFRKIFWNYGTKAKVSHSLFTFLLWLTKFKWWALFHSISFLPSTSQRIMILPLSWCQQMFPSKQIVLFRCKMFKNIKPL